MLEDYEYHFFISYSRSEDVHGWVHNHFSPVLTNCLGSLMDEEPRIFIDEQMDTGVDWPNEMANALCRSCYLVSIWSPQYFRSKWCLAEWKSMCAREEQLVANGFAEDGRRLVYPIVYSDGKHFPEEAARTQAKMDFYGYTYPYEQFREAEKYLEFHDRVYEVAAELEQWLDNIPPWDPDWELIEPDEGLPIRMRFERL